MITVKQLIDKLQKEDPNAIVLINGYEYGMEFLRTEDAPTYGGGLVRGKFKLPKDTENGDIGSCGGLLEEDENGDTNFLLFQRN